MIPAFHLDHLSDLFDYTIYVPTLLRMAVAVFFVYIAQYLYRNGAEIKRIQLPIIGKPSKWIVWVSAGITLITAFFLFVGLETRYAAILGIIITLKYLCMPKRLTSLAPFERSTFILLALICFSLVIFGSGQFAFDYAAL